MANVSDDRWGSFWIWATILIVLLTIVVSWMAASDRVDDDIPGNAPATTGAVTPAPGGAAGDDIAVIAPALAHVGA